MGLAIGLAVVFAFILIASIPDRISCHATWSESGHKSTYSIMSGCRVEVNGKWIPSDAVRSIDL